MRVVRGKKDGVIYVHTWSEERCLEWIEKYGDSGIFMDKTLTKASFEPYFKQ